jgi:hypothetical protein
LGISNLQNIYLFFRAHQDNPLILKIMVQTKALAIEADTGQVAKACAV